MNAIVAAPATLESIDGRLARILRQDAKHWRAMILDGGEPRWISLNSEDYTLLVGCGVAEGAFSAGEYVFKVPEQPVVHLSCDENTNCHLVGVWRDGRIIQHGEAAKPVVLKKDGIEYIRGQMEAALEKRRQERRAQHSAENHILTPEDIAREEAEIAFEVVSHVDMLQDNLGKVMLQTLWHVRSGGLHLKLPDAPAGVADAIRSLTFRNRDYVMSLALVVDRIFPEVDALVKHGTPFLNPETGKPITVDHLIASDGLIRKLTKSSDHWTKLLDLDDKRALIGAIMTQNVDKVAALRDAQQSIQKSGGDTAHMTITVKEEPLPDDPKRTRLTMVLDEPQLRAVMRLLKPLIEVTQ